MATVRGGEVDDHLSLNDNGKVIAMINKFNYGTTVVEKVAFSDYIVKINMMDMRQERVLMISNKAVYNLTTNFSSVKRRITFDQIEAVTISEPSNEFVIHVPSEYDYRYITSRRDDVIRCLQTAYKAEAKKDLVVNISKEPDLSSVCVTKIMGKKTKMQIIQERMASTKTALLGGAVASPPKKGAKAGKGAKSPGGDEEGRGRGRGMTAWGDETAKPKATLDDFDLLKVIGRGSFGKVMMVKKKKGENAGKIFALKILKKAAIIARNQVEHTKAERKILEEIDHPFLMKLHYAFQSPTKLYLVMDYLTGGELFFHLRNDRRFPEDRVRIYAAEIVLGLDHLHTQNIVYRDLKPENIILEASGHLRLTDFGLSKEFKAGDLALTFCGTPEYLAPEIIRGDGHGKEVDWWSLGILIYEMIYGVPPFYSTNHNDMYYLIEHQELTFRSNARASWEVKSLITQLLQRKPHERLGTGPDGGKNIKEQPFFAGIDWDKLYKKEVPAPFVPKVVSESDTSNVDTEFTNEDVVDSVADPSQLGHGAKDMFDSFTYVPKSKLGDTKGGHGGGVDELAEES